MANTVTQPIKDIEQIRAFKKAVAEGQNGYRNLVMVELGLATALRIGDILKLQKKMIHDGFIRVETSKTGVFKNLELNPRVARLVSAYTDTMEDEDYLFNIKYVQAWKIIKKAAATAGIRNIGSHSLRKTTAWHFYISTENDLNKTMKLLGHKEPRETLAYLNLNDDEVNRHLVKMDLD